MRVLRTLMRLRCTATQRPCTWRSSRHTTCPCVGFSTPVTANLAPVFARRLSVVMVRLGTTLTATGADSSRGRVPSPANTARTLPLAGSVTLVAQLPSGPAWVVEIWLKIVPARAYSTLRVAPDGEEPSAKRSWPETATGWAPRWLEALTVIAETGTA